MEEERIPNIKIGDWVRLRGLWGQVYHIDLEHRMIIVTGWNGFKFSTFGYWMFRNIGYKE